MNKRLSAALAVLVMISVPTAAFADDGRRARRVWNPEDPAASLLAGNEVCTGSSRLHTCATLVPLTQEIVLQTVSRPIGLNQNVVANRIVAATATGLFARNEQTGQLIPAIMDVRSSDNAAAVWNRNLGNIFSATMNGVGASAVNALTNPCGSGGCGTSNVIVNQGSQALAQSVSQSNAGVNVDVRGLAGCASSGVCGGSDPHNQ